MMFRSISVGGCNDPSTIMNNRGDLATDPCRSGSGVCTDNVVTSWQTAAADLNRKIQNAWAELLKAELAHGVTTEQNRLHPRKQEAGVAYAGIEYIDIPVGMEGIERTQFVVQITTWMAYAECILDELNDAVAKYKFKPPAPQPVGPTPVGPYGPSSPGATTSSNTAYIAAAAILIAGGIYLYSTR